MTWVYFGLAALGVWLMFRDVRGYMDRRLNNIEQRLEIIRQIVIEPKRHQLEEDDHWRPS